MSGYRSSTRRTPSPVRDPGARWEEFRAQWLARRAPTTVINDDGDGAQPAGAGNGEAAGETEPRQAKRSRDPVFHDRIATLERLLREANALATGSSSGASGNGTELAALAQQPMSTDRATVIARATAAAAGKVIAVGDGRGGQAPKGGAKAAVEALPQDEEEEPDGGMPIRDHGAQGDPTHDLKKVSESIFLAFKQGRPLREPLPLALVTSLLFRSWYLDGTIPADYKPEEAALSPSPAAPHPPPASGPTTGAGAPIPIPRHVLAGEDTLVSSPSPAASFISDGSSTPDRGPLEDSGAGSGGSGSRSRGRPEPAERRPSLLAALAEQNSNAVTPLPSSDESGSGGVGAAPAGVHGEPQTGGGTRSLAVGPMPTATRSPSLEGMGGSSASGGKLQLDLLRGSRWRTEQEVASGSDVI